MDTDIYDLISEENKEIIKKILDKTSDIELLRKQEVAYRINIVIEQMKKDQFSTIKNEDFVESDLVGLGEEALTKIYERLSQRERSAKSIVDTQIAIYDKIKKGDL